MRPLSIVYVVLALLMLSAPLGSLIVREFEELAQQIAADEATNTDSATVQENPPLSWSWRQRGVRDTLTWAGVFAVAVFFGEAYRRIRSRSKKVPMLSVRLSNAYIVLMLLTVSPVVAAFYHAEWGQSRFSKSPETAISILWWAVMSAGAFVVFAIAGEIHLHRSRARISNADETRNTDEYPDLASVQSPDAVYPTEMTATEIRQSHLKHEASVKSVGVLYIILGVLIAIMGGLNGGFFDEQSPMSIRNIVALSTLILVTFFVAMGAFLFVVGLGLRGLKSWARMPTVIVSAFGLAAFPLTIISACIIYLVVCAKGKTVFSPEYKQIMADTPEMKCKTSIVVWIILGAPIVVLGLCIIGELVSSLSR